MNKRILIALLVPLMCSGMAVARTAPETQPGYTTERLSQETLDTLLAPIALYPDTLITHILIASTYPLQVVEADRWRQQNPSLEGDQLERALANTDWDPSVKALVPFTDILRNMSDDLAWLQNLGDAVITNEDWVLDRVQALRLQARESGNLQSNDYQQVSTQDKIIVIESRRPEVVYIPYYDTRYVYGHWHYHTQPIFWPAAVRIALGHRIYWGPHVSISAGFYFGDIWWPERHIVIRNTPTRHYVRAYYPDKRHYSVKEYHRWEHNVANRHARYSQHVITHKPAVADKHRSLNNAAKHRELYTKTQATSGYRNNGGDKRLAQTKTDKTSPEAVYRQDAGQLKQRLKSHEDANRAGQRDVAKGPGERVKSAPVERQQREDKPTQRKQQPLPQSSERVTTDHRQSTDNGGAKVDRQRQAKAEARQSRPERQSHSKPSRPDHAQQSRPNREH